MNDALNTAPTVKTVGPSGIPSSSYHYVFAQDRGTANWFAAATVGEYDGAGWILGDGEFEAPGGGQPGFDLIAREFEPTHWAVIEYAPIPIPGAVWLLGSGLVGLIGIRRKLNK